MEQLFGINKADNSVGVFKCKYLVWAVVIASLLLRLYHLLYNRSLWEDEVYLSTGLVNYDLKHILTQPISFQQKAPVGYLAIVKIIITVFGTSEITLRLFPFICGCLSLLLFVPVIRYFFKPAGYITAIIVIAFSPIVVYHGVEAKQYAVELFSVVLIMYLYIKYHRESNIKKLLYWGIWGAVIVWFSFASIFALAAIAFAMGITFLIKQRFDLLKGGFIVWGLWFGSFIINYVFFSGKDADTGWLVFFFIKHNGFMPISADTIPWVAQRLVAFLNYPAGLSWTSIYGMPSIIDQAVARMIFVPIILAFAGLYGLFKKNRELLLIITAAFVFTLAASAVKMYPFHERLTLFLLPLFIFLLAAGTDHLAGTVLKKPVLQIAMIALIAYGPVKNTIIQTAKPFLFGDYKKSYQQEAMAYLNSRYRPGDVVYVYWNNLPGYRFYTKMKGYKFNTVKGKDYRYKTGNFTGYFNRVNADLAVFKGKHRVWIVQNYRIDIAIGDYIDDPKWYYLRNDGPHRFAEEVKKLGTAIETYKPADKRSYIDVGVTLMDFNKN